MCHKRASEALGGGQGTGGEGTSAGLVVDELQAGGAVALEADHHVLTHVGAAAVVQQTLVHTWKDRNVRLFKSSGQRKLIHIWNNSCLSIHTRAAK